MLNDTDKKQNGDGGGVVLGGETLHGKAKRIGAALRSSDTGPLVIAVEVMEIARDWKAWKAETDGLTCDGWCSVALGKPLRFFRNRADAVRVLGPESRRLFHHEAAVWLARKSLPDDVRKDCVRQLVLATQKNHGHPLSLSEAVGLLTPTIGKSPRGTVCAGCVLLDIKVERLEAENAALKEALRNTGADIDAVLERVAAETRRQD